MSNDRAIEMTLDEQIAIVEHEVKEDEGEASYRASVAILTSLRTLKRIQDATMPELVGYVRDAELKILREYGFVHAELTGTVKVGKSALYGPEVLDLLAREHQDKEQALYALSQVNDKYVLLESKLAKVMEGLKDPTEEMVADGKAVIKHGDPHWVFTAMSAALLRSVEGGEEK